MSAQRKSETWDGPNTRGEDCSPRGSVAATAPVAAGAHRLAVALVAATLVLLLAGGQVTSTESGDAVPTWPFPLTLPLVGGVLWELGHRQVAGAVGLLTAALALWLAREGRRGRGPPRMRLLGWSALALVVVQALLGGLRVLTGAQDAAAGTPEESWSLRLVAIVHACTAQAFLLLAVTLATVTASRFQRAPRRSLPGLRASAMVATVLVFVQIILGAILRHTMSGLGLAVHVVGASAVLVAAGMVAARILSSSSEDALRRPAIGLGLLLMAQLFLGVASLVLVNRGFPRSPELSIQGVIPTLHLLAGAAILACCHLITLRAGRDLSLPEISSSAGLAAKGAMS